MAMKGLTLAQLNERKRNLQLNGATAQNTMPRALNGDASTRAMWSAPDPKPTPAPESVKTENELRVEARARFISEANEAVLMATLNKSLRAKGMLYLSAARFYSAAGMKQTGALCYKAHLITMALWRGDLTAKARMIAEAVS